MVGYFYLCSAPSICLLGLVSSVPCPSVPLSVFLCPPQQLVPVFQDFHSFGVCLLQPLASMRASHQSHCTSQNPQPPSSPPSCQQALQSLPASAPVLPPSLPNKLLLEASWVLIIICCTFTVCPGSSTLYYLIWRFSSSSLCLIDWQATAFIPPMLSRTEAMPHRLVALAGSLVTVTFLCQLH